MCRIKILLVDDDEDDFILTRDVLTRAAHGDIYELSWCNNYAAAINAMLKCHYDIYLVDYHLGKYSGLDLLNEAVRSNCSEPVIILTGKGDSKIDEEALRLGAADYLTKDELNSEILTRAIRYALRHHNTLGQLRSSENKFRILFERSKDPIMITDAEGFVFEANDAAVEFLDTTPDRLNNETLFSFYKNEEDKELFNNTMERLGSVKDMELEIISSSGKTKYCSISSFIQISQHGHKELYYSILHGIPPVKHTEREPGAPDKYVSVTRLANVMASEVYNPLSNINFATEELKNNPDRYRNEELLDIIRKNCERINQVTSTLIEEVKKE